MNILIIGEECEDIFEYGRCTRLNPEAPTPIFVPTNTVKARGMAANVYENMQSITDRAHGITLITPTSCNMTKRRFVDEASNYIILRVDSDPIIEPLVMTSDLKYLIQESDCVVVSDYNKGFLSTQVLEEIAKLAKLSFIDTKKPFNEWIMSFDWIKVNSKEFANPLHDPMVAAKKYESTIITMGKDGAINNGKLIRPENPTQILDVCGAGDTFLAALVANYLQTADIFSAIHFANFCAGQAVSQRGVVAVTRPI